MSEQGLHVNKYQVSALLRGNAVEWSLALEAENGEKYDLPIRDGAEIPVLLDVLRHDATIFFDPRSGRFSTGWNDPGDKD